MGRRRIPCRTVVEVLTDYLEDALPAARRRGVQAHLATCRHCAIYLGQLLATVRLTALLREAP